ncbi:hypothetical protein MMC07_000202 [Pseudocyphellaria aurata]|nr:hypothetical protein [Pseudocyphellaria aurata]
MINSKTTTMQFRAVALCLLTALTPHIATESTVQLPPGPLPLPSNSTGAAVVTPNGFTRIFYLAADNSIHELRGAGVPKPGLNYLDSLRVPASKVRTDSPLAAIELSRDAEDIRLYYIGPDNYLKEFAIPALVDGDLNGAKFAVKAGSRYIYAMSVIGSYVPRIGYQCPDGNLCEANWDGGWHTQEI